MILLEFSELFDSMDRCHAEWLAAEEKRHRAIIENLMAAEGGLRHRLKMNAAAMKAVLATEVAD